MNLQQSGGTTRAL